MLNQYLTLGYFPEKIRSLGIPVTNKKPAPGGIAQSAELPHPTLKNFYLNFS
jgi:hypothetical protein